MFTSSLPYECVRGQPEYDQRQLYLMCRFEQCSFVYSPVRTKSKRVPRYCKSCSCCNAVRHLRNSVRWFPLELVTFSLRIDPECKHPMTVLFASGFRNQSCLRATSMSSAKSTLQQLPRPRPRTPSMSESLRYQSLLHTAISNYNVV